MSTLNVNELAPRTGSEVSLGTAAQTLRLKNTTATIHGDGSVTVEGATGVSVDASTGSVELKVDGSTIVEVEDGDVTITGDLNVSGAVVAATVGDSGTVYQGDGTALSGAGGSGGVENVGTTTIGADTGDAGVGTIELEIGGVAKARLQNDGTFVSLVDIQTPRVWADEEELTLEATSTQPINFKTNDTLRASIAGDGTFNVVGRAEAATAKVGGTGAPPAGHAQMVVGRQLSRISAVRAYRTSGQAITLVANTFYPIVLNAIASGFNSADVIDSTEWFNTTNGRFTPLKPGFWLITGQLIWGANEAVTGEISVALRQNGTTVLASMTSGFAFGGSVLTYGAPVTDLVHFNGSTDYLEIGLIGTQAYSLNTFLGSERLFLTAIYQGYGATAPS